MLLMPFSAKADWEDYLPPGATIEWKENSLGKKKDSDQYLYGWTCFDLQGVKYMFAGAAQEGVLTVVPRCPKKINPEPPVNNSPAPD